LTQLDEYPGWCSCFGSRCFGIELNDCIEQNPGYGVVQRPYKENEVKATIEIRPGEGGEDAKLLVRDQAALYINYAERVNLSVELIDEGAG